MKYEDVKIGETYRVEFDGGSTYDTEVVHISKPNRAFALKGLEGLFTSSRLTPIEPEQVEDTKSEICLKNPYDESPLGRKNLRAKLSGIFEKGLEAKGALDLMDEIEDYRKSAEKKQAELNELLEGLDG